MDTLESIMNTTGRIFDVQKFSTHDGPGIRTIVFLKGCILRCRWCCNPESQEYKIQEMVQNGKTKIIGRDVTVKEVLEDVVKDMPYYRRSGGGLTLSGGEAMCQKEFGLALLKGAHHMGINTAIETTANLPFETVKEFAENLDYILMDIKHTDARKHKEFTGVSNELILENAHKLSQIAKSLTIRVPVIPTFNDTEEEIFSIAKFAKSLRGVEEIHLLPYHRLGYDKYVGLGREYLMGDVQSPSKEHMEKLKKSAECSGLRVVIGG